jgi:hypothetical protein
VARWIGGYCTAQICQNGHVIVTGMETSPDLKADYCKDCGAGTTTKCPACGTPIRGRYDVEGFIGLTEYTAPSFCHACGAAYPWTAAKLEAARELADELDGLTADERESLKGTLDDLVKDTPRTQIASTRFKRLMSKVGQSGASAMRDIIVDVLSEGAKKMIVG